MTFTGKVYVSSGDQGAGWVGAGEGQNPGPGLFQLLLDTEIMTEENALPRLHSPLTDGKVLLL